MRTYNKTIRKEQDMGLKPSSVNNLLRSKGNYSNRGRSDNLQMVDLGKQPANNWLSFLFDGDTYRYYYLPRFQKLFKVQEMAEVKIGWIILNMLGVPIYIFGIVNNLDNYKSAILFLMGLLYSVTVLMRSYEKWRKEKIANDREEFHLEIERNKKAPKSIKQP